MLNHIFRRGSSKEHDSTKIPNEIINPLLLPNSSVLFPDDIWNEILSHLSKRELYLSVALVSKEWNYAVMNAYRLNVNCTKYTNIKKPILFTKAGFPFLSKANIVSIEVTGQFFNSGTAKLMSECKLVNLRSISISYSALGDSGADYIKTMNQLTSLTIIKSGITKKGCKYLSYMSNLTSLNLNQNNFGPKAVNYLTPLRNLKSLFLFNTHIESMGAMILSCMNNLTTLDVSYCYVKFGIEGARHISEMKNLTKLIISEDYIGDEGAKWIGTMENLTELVSVDNKITDEGIKSFSNLTKLTSLNVSNNKFRTDGVDILASMTHLRKLEMLSIYLKNSVETVCSMKHLTYLKIDKNLFGKENIHLLEPMKPHTKVILQTL